MDMDAQRPKVHSYKREANKAKNKMTCIISRVRNTNGLGKGETSIDYTWCPYCKNCSSRTLIRQEFITFCPTLSIHYKTTFIQWFRVSLPADPQLFGSGTGVLDWTLSALTYVLGANCPSESFLLLRMKVSQLESWWTQSGYNPFHLQSDNHHIFSKRKENFLWDINWLLLVSTGSEGDLSINP